MNLKKTKAAFICWIKRIKTVLPVFFWVFLIFSVDEVDMAIMTVVSALIHESGHIAYICIAKRIKPTLKGVLSGFRITNIRGLSYDEEIKMYLSGPVVNIIAFLACSFISRLTTFDLWLLGVINMATAISNLVPIKGYDGYGVVRAFITKNELGEPAIKALSYVSSGLIFFLCILSLYFINRFGGGYWIFFVFFISMLKHFKEGFC